MTRKLNRSLSFDRWPGADRLAWHSARNAGSILDDGGAASRWRAASCKTIIHSYGRWLAFLEEQNLLDRCARPAERCRPEMVRAYVERLGSTTRPVSVDSSIRELFVCLSVMEPLADLRWLKTVSNKLHRSAIPMHRPAHRVSSKVFFRKAVRELAYLSRLDLTRKANATRFRNALTLALQAACPLRRKNLAGLTVGGSLIKLGNQFEIAIDGSEMKNGRDHRVVVPQTLTRYLQVYLDVVRPILLHGLHSSAVWINWYGSPMNDHAVYLRFAKYTKQLFGFVVSIHDLRHCAASTLAVTSVSSAYSAQGLLGHSDIRTTQQYYIKARQLEASRRVNSLLFQMR